MEFQNWCWTFNLSYNAMDTKTTQMKINGGYLFRACTSKGVSHHHLCRAETQRETREWESFQVRKKKKESEDFRYMLWLESVDMGKLEMG